ncbi:hypothetical protein ACFCV3_00465 [Kribbella sp. NPDC056345]
MPNLEMEVSTEGDSTLSADEESFLSGLAIADVTSTGVAMCNGSAC